MASTTPTVRSVSPPHSDSSPPSADESCGHSSESSLGLRARVPSPTSTATTEPDSRMLAEQLVASKEKRQPTTSPTTSLWSTWRIHILMAGVFCIQFCLIPTATLMETAARIYRDLDWQQFGIDILHPTAPLYPTVGYLALMRLAKPCSEDFVKNTMKPFLKKYNLGMSLFSLGCTIVMATAMWEVSSTVGMYTNDCDAALKNWKYSAVMWVFYVSKVVEYIDSWSLHAAGKHVSWLQFLHHMGAPWMMWLGAHYNVEGGWTATLMNSFVHFVMYGYYYLTICGYRPKWKMLMTSMQLTQFVTALCVAWPYHSLPCMREPQNAGKMMALVFTFFYTGIVMFLFLNFSLYSYVLKRGKPRPSAKKQQ